MRLKEIRDILGAEVLCGEDMLESEVCSACGSDLMSDVLAYVKNQGVLLTGLVSPQVVRTAEMMDILCVVFIRGKRPDETILQLAQDRQLVVMATAERMYSACGKLYAGGLTESQQ